MCKTPVTLGGGITMQYGSFSGFGTDLKKPWSIQYWYHLSSTRAGSYLVDNIPSLSGRKNNQNDRIRQIPGVLLQFGGFRQAGSGEILTG
jgi:hypothetical protein